MLMIISTNIIFQVMPMVVRGLTVMMSILSIPTLS